MSWRHVFRNGFAPAMTLVGLQSLRDALERNDQRLTQGSTTTPPPLMCVQDWPVEASDPIAWSGWQGGANPECSTVGQVEAHFAHLCFEADKRLGVAECRHFLNWWDGGKPELVRANLLAEVDQEIERQAQAFENWKADRDMERAEQNPDQVAGVEPAEDMPF